MPPMTVSGENQNICQLRLYLVNKEDWWCNIILSNPVRESKSNNLLISLVMDFTTEADALMKFIALMIGCS